MGLQSVPVITPTIYLHLNPIKGTAFDLLNSNIEILHFKLFSYHNENKKKKKKNILNNKNTKNKKNKSKKKKK